MRMTGKGTTEPHGEPGAPLPARAGHAPPWAATRVTPVTPRLPAPPRARGHPGSPFDGRVEWPRRITVVRGEAGANPALTPQP